MCVFISYIHFPDEGFCQPKHVELFKYTSKCKPCASLYNWYGIKLQEAKRCQHWRQYALCAPLPSQPANIRNVRFRQTIQRLVDPWNIVDVSNCSLVQHPIVDTESQSTISFPNKNDRKRPRTLRRSDVASIQHILNMLLGLLIHRRRNATRPNTDRSIIGEVDTMLHCRSVAKVEVG